MVIGSLSGVNGRVAVCVACASTVSDAGEYGLRCSSDVLMGGSVCGELSRHVVVFVGIDGILRIGVRLVTVHGDLVLVVLWAFVTVLWWVRIGFVVCWRLMVMNLSFVDDSSFLVSHVGCTDVDSCCCLCL